MRKKCGIVGRIVFATTCCLLIIAGCESFTSKRVQTLESDMLEGSWVCVDILDNAEKMLSTKRLGDFPPYTELLFADSGKLVAFNGQVEMVSLTYVHKGSAVQIPEFYGSEKTILNRASDSVLIFQDDVLGKQWKYVKVSDSLLNAEGVSEAFPAMLNRGLVAGDYTVTNTDKPYIITFRGNGYIHGSPQFTNYSICYSGDCANFSTGDLIYLSNDHQQGEYYGWTRQGDEFTIYSLRAVSTADEMPNYEYVKPVLVMKKK